MKIKSIKAIEVLDSRGRPTVYAFVNLKDGSKGEAYVPSGASTGSLEAHELRDSDNRFCGLGVMQSVENINNIIQPSLINKDASDQEKIDKLMCELDATKNKSKLGANSILAVSLAVSRSAANSLNIPLYEYLNILYKKRFNREVQMSLPRPMLNIFNGGGHANNTIDIQEFMILPDVKFEFSEGLRLSTEVYMNLKKILSEKGLSTTVGDEGGFAPNLRTNEEVIEHIIQAVEVSGMRYGEDIHLGLDCAATEFFQDGTYVLKGENKQLSSLEMIDYLKDLINKFQIISVEDPLDENDWDSWAKITAECPNTQIVGDDIFVTQSKLLDRGIKENAGNAILVKLNQVGSLSETMEAINLAQNNNFSTVISHRSGETEDSFISDLSVAVNAKQIKTGAPARSDRTAKYNRLLIINSELYP